MMIRMSPLLLSSIFLFAITPASGEPKSTSTAESAERIEVDGYLGRPIDSHPGSLTAGLLAVGPGAFFHGLGHFHVGQEERGLALLATEIAGLGLVILSDTLESSESGDGTSRVYQQILAQSGWSLFFGSWFADIIGGTRGSRPFDRINAAEDAASLELGYSYLTSQRQSNQHLVSLNLGGRSKVVAFALQHSQSSSSGSWLTRMSADARIETPSIGLLAAGLQIGNSTRYEQNWSFVDATPYLRWQLELGLLMSSLRNASFVGRIGYGRSGYIFNRIGVTTIWQTKDLWTERFVYDTGLRFALGPKLVSEISLVHDTSLWVGPSNFQPSETFVPRSMLWRGRFRYRYRELHFNIDILSGDGQQVTLALEYEL